MSHRKAELLKVAPFLHSNSAVVWEVNESFLFLSEEHRAERGETRGC